jgi:hypothetical protein
VLLIIIRSSTPRIFSYSILRNLGAKGSLSMLGSTSAPFSLVVCSLCTANTQDAHFHLRVLLVESPYRDGVS